jgi:hypothetical protein
MGDSPVIVFRFFKLVSESPEAAIVEPVDVDWGEAVSGVKVGSHHQLEVEREVAHQLGHRDHPRLVSHRRIAQVERNQLFYFLKVRRTV